MDEHVYYLSDDEASIPNFCEDKCQMHFGEGCSFFFMGTQHGTMVCRLYNGCESLVSEFGLDGRLYGAGHDESCVVADPEACWETTLRRDFLTRGTLVPSAYTDFYYLRIHEMCDQLLLMGGAGVHGCARPSYRAPNSHQWEHKGPIPETVAHGAGVQVSCWGGTLYWYVC